MDGGCGLWLGRAAGDCGQSLVMRSPIAAVPLAHQAIPPPNPLRCWGHCCEARHCEEFIYLVHCPLLLLRGSGSVSRPVAAAILTGGAAHASNSEVQGLGAVGLAGLGRLRAARRKALAGE